MAYWFLTLTILMVSQGLAWGAAVGLTPVSLPLPPIDSRSETPPSEHAADTVMAVGFGYQHGTTSTIRIRTYDVHSGDLLSEEEFELNVVGGEGKDGVAVGDRVFAGAVSLGVGGLGEFPMRVYDAKSGRYLWQGHLNFVDIGSDDPRRRVTATANRSSSARTVTFSFAEEPTDIESLFLIRAVDSTSGKAIWQHSFRSAPPMPESIAGNKEQESGLYADMVMDFEVVVRSYERESGKLVWSDRLSTRDRMEELADGEAEDRARQLPLFPVRVQDGKVWAREEGAKPDDYRRPV